MGYKRLLFASLFTITLSITLISPIKTKGNEIVDDSIKKEEISEENNKGKGQLTFVASIPDGFGLTLYVNVWNYNTGEEYELYLYPTNDYIGYLSLDPASYMIGQISVCDDNTNDFPILWEKDGEIINLEYNDVITITCKLANEEDIIQQIEEKKNKYGKTNTTVSEDISAPATSENSSETKEIANEANEVSTEVSKESYTGEEEEENSNSTLVIMLGVITIIILVLGLGVYILYCKNIKSKDDLNELFK